MRRCSNLYLEQKWSLKCRNSQRKDHHGVNYMVVKNIIALIRHQTNRSRKKCEDVEDIIRNFEGFY
jgi:hypothetical protein